ncbi:MAG: hypothetical protein KIG81_05440 [Thermoguttaceae bacterium]|nr:hypothetical protein [Thermoguttaceae bacterium]
MSLLVGNVYALIICKTRRRLVVSRDASSLSVFRQARREGGASVIKSGSRSLCGVAPRSLLPDAFGVDVFI